MQRLSVTQTHEGEGNPQSQLEGQAFDLGGFDDIGSADPKLALEGDSTLQVPWLFFWLIEIETAAVFL